MQDLKVIIIEDDLDIAEIQRRFVQRIDGFELVGIAHTITDAEELIDVFQPNLILLDIYFPSGTGLDLVKKIRSENKNIDIILVTAAKEVKTLQEALRSGVFDYILKPLVFERLQTTFNDYKKHFDKIKSSDLIEQSDIDKLLPRTNKDKAKASPKRLPKGIDLITLDKIQSLFDNNTGAYSAEEVGEMIGASRTTARRYLEHLTGLGTLATEVKYGSIGRPERKYQKAHQ